MGFEHRYFPRNPDGTLKTKDPCKTPGCNYPNYHVCLVGKPDDGTFARLLASRTKKASGPRVMGERSQAHRDAISLAQRERWAKVHEAEAKRDRKLIEHYNRGGVGIVALALQFGIGKDKVLRILKMAERRGEVVMRPRGHTLAKGAR